MAGKSRTGIRVVLGAWLGLCVLHAPAALAQAQVWMLMTAADTSKGAQYLDLASFRREGPYVEAWVRQKMVPPKETNIGTIHESLILTSFDCERKTIAVGKQILRGSRNEVLDTLEAPARLEFMDAEPTSIGGRMREHVCSSFAAAAAPGERNPAPDDPPADALKRYTWQRLGNYGSKGNVYYLAPDSAQPGTDRNGSGGLIYVLSRIDATPPIEFDNTSATSQILRFVVDCAGRRYTAGNLAYFETSGRMIHRVFARAAPLRPYQTRTAMSEIADIACAQRVATAPAAPAATSAAPEVAAVPAAAPAPGDASGAPFMSASDPPADALTRYTWKAVARGSDGSPRYAAPETIRQGTGNLQNSLVFLIRFQLSPPETIAGRSVATVVTRMAINCGAGQWARGNSAYFDAAGKFASRNQPLQMPGGPIYTGALYEAYGQMLCPGGRVAVAARPGAAPAAAAAGNAPPAQAAKDKPPAKEEKEKHGRGFGTAWLSDTGYLVTAHHVVKDGEKFVIVLADKSLVKAQVVASDPANDLAILSVDLPMAQYRGLPLARTNSPLGASVFALGFPYPDMLGIKPKFTSGAVSSTAGMDDDPRMMQTSTPLQPGNSGGPLINSQGEVVGIVSAGLNSLTMLKETGNVPQNVNYVVKARYLQGLLSDAPPRSSMPPRLKPGSVESMAAQANSAVFLLVVEW